MSPASSPCTAACFRSVRASPRAVHAAGGGRSPSLRAIPAARHPRCAPQLRGLIRRFLPRLSAHFDRHSVDVTWFASEWFLTVFTRSFPFDMVVRVWDVFLAEGWKIVFRVALAILQLSQSACRARCDALRCVPLHSRCGRRCGRHAAAAGYGGHDGTLSRAAALGARRRPCCPLTPPLTRARSAASSTRAWSSKRRSSCGCAPSTCRIWRRSLCGSKLAARSSAQQCALAASRSACSQFLCARVTILACAGAHAHAFTERVTRPSFVGKHTHTSTHLSLTPRPARSSVTRACARMDTC